MNLFYRLLVTGLGLLPLCLHAQDNATISGTVKDPSGKPLAGATVALVNARDSLLKLAVAGDRGDFSFRQPVSSVYRITVSIVGYTPYKSDTFVVHGAKQLEPIVLTNATATQLKDVTITAQKPFVENRIDRTVVNVDALISNAGANALEVLEKSPGVFVDQNGGISLKGKSGVVIYIDDKPTYLNGADLAGYLRSLPSGTLESIELMPIPPAKYDAAGNGGIINIRTKKLKQRGFNGNVSTAYHQGAYSRTFNSINLNIRNNAFNFFINGGFNYTNNYNNLEINRKYYNDDGSLQSSFHQTNFLRRNEKAPSLKIGMDYYKDKNTTIGFMLNGVTRKPSSTGENVSYLFDPVGKLDSVVTADNTETNRYNRLAGNINYRRKFSTAGQELGIDIDYVYDESNREQLFRNGSFLPDGAVKSRDNLIGQLPANINIYSAKADYGQPLKWNVKLDAGVKASYITTNNRANYWIEVNNNTSPDYEKTNHFRYQENINAAYINLSRESRKLSLQAGLRLENTIMDGHQLGNAQKADSSFRRSYTNLFPTFFIQYKADSNEVNVFGLSYSKRIQRPGFGDLNPFVSPLDKFMIYVGNPFLQPVISHAIDLTYTWKSMITWTANYTRFKGEIGETIEAKDNKFYSRPGNVGASDYVSLQVSASLKPAKWVSFNYYAIAEYAMFKATLYDQVLDVSGLNFVTNLVNQYQLGKRWSAEVTGQYRGRIYTQQFILGNFWTMGAAASKKILKDKGSVKLTIQDIFFTRLNYGDIGHLNNASGDYRNQADTRMAGVTFTYNFGKTFETRQRSQGGAGDEQNRIR